MIVPPTSEPIATIPCGKTPIISASRKRSLPTSAVSAPSVEAPTLSTVLFCATIWIAALTHIKGAQSPISYRDMLRAHDSKAQSTANAALSPHAASML